MNQRVRLGLNVYLWDGIWQDRFLAESLLPTVERIELETGPLALWFDRSDRRGPHVYSIVGCPRDSRELVEREITLDIGEYLAAVPADMDESLREMTELRHRACERMVFSKIDRLEGLASPASFALFVQPGDSYPVWYDSLLNETEAFWHDRVDGDELALNFADNCRRVGAK